MEEGARVKIVWSDAGNEKTAYGYYVSEDVHTITLRGEGSGVELRIGKSAMISLKELA